MAERLRWPACIDEALVVVQTMDDVVLEHIAEEVASFASFPVALELQIITKIKEGTTMTDAQKSKLAYHTGFAMQAARMCNGLKWLYSTERALEKLAGEPLRTPSSRFAEDFIRGLCEAIDKHEASPADLEAEAWQRYGECGHDYPGLVHVSAENCLGGKITERDSGTRGGDECLV